MKSSLGILILFFVLVTGVFSCKKDPGPALNMGYNYFPDQVGRYTVFNVDSFYYNTFTSHIDTFKFQIKEKIASTYSDNEGRPSLRLERYVKYYNALTPYASIPWTLRDVWEENVSKSTAEKVEENVRFVKLAFAVKESQKWDGNAQNTLGEEEYTYKFFDLHRTIAGISFDSVLQVQQHDETNFIQKIYSEEKYARNVGLIYKQMINVESQPSLLPPSALSLPIMDRVTSGFQYTMTVESYGTE